MNCMKLPTRAPLGFIFKIVVTAAAFVLSVVNAHAQMIPPGQLRLDGINVACRGAPTVLTTQINDAAMTDGRAIYLNPAVMGSWPTVLKIWMYAHECGHLHVGANESAADCWAVRLGRDQGWFRPAAFQGLMQLLRHNPGDVTHPPGIARLNNMMHCYRN